MGKNLESACKSYAYSQYIMALNAAESAAAEVVAAGGVKSAPAALVAKFVAANAKSDELLAKVS